MKYFLVLYKFQLINCKSCLTGFMACFRPMKLLAAKHPVKYYITRGLSATALAAEEKIPRFRTLENDPTCHSAVHLGKFYTMSAHLKEKLFLGGGIPTKVNEMFKVFQENCILVRSPALEVMSYLEQFNYKHPALRIVIYSRYGAGKTMTIAHLVHYGYNKRYLLLHVPWVSNWTKRPKEILDSSTRPGRYDIPIESTIWLQHFKLQNSELLKELNLTTSKSYTWSLRESTAEGQPLMDVIDHGINRGRHASDCVAVLLKEIKLHSASGKFKTLVIIDGVNAFYAKPNLRLPKKQVGRSLDISIVHAFEKMIKNDWNNAAVITTVDTIPEYRENSETATYTPRSLLKKEGFEVLDPFIPVEVNNYTDKEFESVLDYYIDRKWIQQEAGRSEKGRSELKFLSGNNPFYLMKYCEPL